MGKVNQINIKELMSQFEDSETVSHTACMVLSLLFYTKVGTELVTPVGKFTKLSSDLIYIEPLIDLESYKNVIDSKDTLNLLI